MSGVGAASCWIGLPEEMDPVTHTFVGASLSAAGLRKVTPLATPTLLVAVNLPDVDIAAQMFNSYVALAWRRGITHGLPALVVLPLLLTGAVWAWDRWVRRRRDPGVDPVRPLPLLGLAAIGVWTHPVLDWVNTYGMRWWMPFDPTWTYGDAVFIIDPWLWLALGGSLFLFHSDRLAARMSWALLALALTALVIGTDVAPTGAKIVWCAGVVGWMYFRFRGLPPRSSIPVGTDPVQDDRSHRERVKERAVRWALVGTCAYLGTMVALTPVSERVTLAQARDLGIAEVEDVMVGPSPGNPFRGQVVLRTPDGYYLGEFSWFGSARLAADPVFLPSHPRDAVVRAAEAHPDARRYLVWARFPWYRVVATQNGWRVEIRDARYTGRGTDGLAGVSVELDRNLEFLPSSAEGGSAQADSILAEATFDSVWTRIRDTHYDPDLLGLDWDEVRLELRPRAIEAETAGELRSVLTEMLDRLGESHFSILPGAVADPITTGEAPGDGDVGLAFRWVEDALLVAAVRPGSPAEHAEVQAGWVLEQIDGTPIDSLVARIREGASEPDRDRHLAVWLPMTVGQRTLGPVNTPVRLHLRDGDERVRSVEISRAPASGNRVAFGHLPPVLVEVDHEILSPQPDVRVGILRLSAWFPTATPAIESAMEELREADGIILDLRGNPGGLAAMVMGVGGHFMDVAVSLGTMRTREGTLHFPVNPRRVTDDGRRVTPFAGPLAILTDPLTASTSEIFAGSMQALGRARVFGEPTAGQALPALVSQLPNGDLLLHAIAEYTTPDGSRLEGTGVRPDVAVPPNQVALLAGHDLALQSALQWILEESSQ